MLDSVSEGILSPESGLNGISLYKRGIVQIIVIFFIHVPQFWKKQNLPYIGLPNLARRLVMGEIFVQFLFCLFVDLPHSKMEGTFGF